MANDLSLKRRDLQPCGFCGRGVMHAGGLLFYRGTLQAMIADVPAIRQEAGLEQVFGGGRAGATLAAVMGPDPDLARAVAPSLPFLVCQPCALEARPLALLLESDSKVAARG